VVGEEQLGFRGTWIDVWLERNSLASVGAGMVARIVAQLAIDLQDKKCMLVEVAGSTVAIRGPRFTLKSAEVGQVAFEASVSR
jgi:hypothetical protein